MKTVKRVQQLYQERNKLLEESGLGDFAHTDEEIEQLVAEAIEKDISKSIENGKIC